MVFKVSTIWVPASTITKFILTEIFLINSFIFLISSTTKSFIKHMYSSLTPNLAKLARFWSTLATRVSLRAVFSLGYSDREGTRKDKLHG